MNSTRSSLLATVAIATVVNSAALVAHGAAISPTAFVTPLVDDFTGLGLPTTNNGPLLRSEGTFSFSPTQFRYVNLGGTPFFGEAIGTNFQTGSIDLALGAATPRVGLYLTASDGTVQFYDASNNLIGTLNYTNPGSGYNFYGWEDTTNLIARVLVTDIDAQDGAITFMDRVTTEAAVPEPGTAAVAVGVLVFGFRATRSRRGATVAQRGLAGV